MRCTELAGFHVQLHEWKSWSRDNRRGVCLYLPYFLKGFFEIIQRYRGRANSAMWLFFSKPALLLCPQTVSARQSGTASSVGLRGVRGTWCPWCVRSTFMTSTTKVRPAPEQQRTRWKERASRADGGRANTTSPFFTISTITRLPLRRKPRAN